MTNTESPQTPEQKLLHAIFAPDDSAPRLADKTGHVFDRIKLRLRGSYSQSPPFVNRIEACGMIRACLDRMWNLVLHDAEHFFDANNFEAGDFNEVIRDYAFDLATAVCRMLVDLDFTDPQASENRKAP